MNDPASQLARLAFPRYRGRDITITAFVEDLPEANDGREQRWVAINMATGAKLPVPPWPRVNFPGGHPSVAYVAKLRRAGIRIFVHPATIARNLLPQHATLTFDDRVVLYALAHFKRGAVVDVVADHGLDPARCHAAIGSLIRQGFIGRRHALSTSGRVAVRRYWSFLCLSWA